MCGYKDYAELGHLWDVHCAREDELRQARFKYGECGNCENYNPVPAWSCQEDVKCGWCSDKCDYVAGDESPEANDCEYWAA